MFGLGGTEARLPTYRTAARVLEGEKGSGTKLLGWTVARTFMIAPPFLVVGVPLKQAFAGAVFASCLISVFTLARLHNARNHAQISGPRRRPQRRLAPLRTATR